MFGKEDDMEMEYYNVGCRSCDEFMVWISMRMNENTDRDMENKYMMMQIPIGMNE